MKKQLVDPKLNMKDVFCKRRAANNNHQESQEASTTRTLVIASQPKPCTQEQERQGGVDLHRLECWSNVGQGRYIESPSAENHESQNCDKKNDYLGCLTKPER